MHGIETPPHADIVNLFPIVNGANGNTKRREPGERTMTVFTQHPHAQGVSYAEHLDFAIGIAWRLFMCVLSFTTHALFPFISINRQLDLEATSAFLLERNRFIEAAAAGSRTQPGPGRASLASGHNKPAVV